MVMFVSTTIKGHSQFDIIMSDVCGLARGGGGNSYCMFLRIEMLLLCLRTKSETVVIQITGIANNIHTDITASQQVS